MRVSNLNLQPNEEDVVLSGEQLVIMPFAPCTINLFGDLRLEATGAAVTRFRTRKIAALLGALAYHSDRSFRRDELIEMLWPDTELESGRNRLRIALCGLRSDLDGAQVDDNLLQADRLYVKLAAENFRTDREEFESCMRLADVAAEGAARTSLWERALALYVGELLPGHEETWVVGERERLRGMALTALRGIIGHYAATGQPEEALVYAARAVQVEPLNEETHRLVMRLQMALQRPGDALRQYAVLERLLREQLNIGPSARSRALADDCRRQNPPTPPLREIAVDLTVEASLATAAMKTIVATGDTEANVGREDVAGTQAENVGVTAKESPSPLPVPVVAPAGIRQAPELTVTLYGREAAIHEIGALLARPDLRLVTLTGPGGIGKTCLALAVAAAVRDRFADGVCFVALADLADADQIADSTARALGLRGGEPEACIDQIAEFAAGRSLLLVLDNLEHLAEQAAPVLSALLSRAPGLRILTTSRQRLRLVAEQEFAVPPLPLPRDDSPAALAANPGVQLFLDRAGKVRAGFRLTADNAPDIATICRSLDGIPLGIELVASWTQLLTPAEVRTRFEGRYIEVTSRYRAMPDRQRSLRRVVETSCELLTAGATRLFAALSVLRGTFGLTAIEAVASAADPYELLAELMDHSLLALRESGRETRFSLLEPLREFAATLLTPLEQDEFARRHAVYFQRLAEAADARLRGPETLAALQSLDEEWPNLRAALDRFGADPQLGVPLAGALRRYWPLRGRYAEGLAWLEKALAGAASGPTELHTRTLRAAGNHAMRLSRYDVAEVHFRAALALESATGDRLATASTLGNLGQVAERQGDIPGAITLLQQSLAIYREAEDRMGVANMISCLASLHVNAGDLEVGLPLYTEGNALFRELGALDNLIVGLGNLANVQCRRGRIAEAHAALVECLPLVRELGNRVELGYWLETHALIAICTSAPARAAQFCGKADAVFREMAFERPADERFVTQADLEAARITLGEPAFAAAWQQGSEWSDDEAIAAALT